MLPSIKRVLLLSPHADDVEIGAGGFMARVIDQGAEVMVVVMTVSDIRFRHRGVVSVEERISEFTRSMHHLGVQHWKWLSEGLDGQMYTAPQSRFVGELDDLQDSFRPDVVLIPLPSSHQDHRYCWEVGVAATRPSAAKWMPTMIAAYEYPATNWGDGAEMNAGKGGIYVDVTDYWEKKLGCLDCYQSQMRGPHHLFSFEGIESLAKMRGLESGYGKAELFHALRIRL